MPTVYSQYFHLAYRATNFILITFLQMLLCWPFDAITDAHYFDKLLLSLWIKSRFG